MRGIFALLGLLILTVPARGTLPAQQPYRIAENGRLLTDVMINGQGPFTFLIDTASSTSLMFEHVRKKLNLGQSQPEHLRVYGINDVADALPVKPDSLSVAGEQVKDLTICSIARRRAERPGRRAGPGCAGALFCGAGPRHDAAETAAAGPGQRQTL